MKEKLREYFYSQGIEYFAMLDYSDCRQTNERIIAREAFTPRSVIVYLLPYYSGDTENISLYAASLDYHLAIREINSGLAELLKEKILEKYHGADVIVAPARGLCSFYAEAGGLLVGFEV